MTQGRREVLHEVLDGLERLRAPDIAKTTAQKILREAKKEVKHCIDEENKAIAAVPENLRWSTRNVFLNQNVKNLSESLESINQSISVCNSLSPYSYEPIRSSIVKAYRSIREAIER